VQETSGTSDPLLVDLVDVSQRGLRDSMLGRGAAIDEVVPSVGSGRGNEVSRDGRDAQNHFSLRPHGIALTKSLAFCRARRTLAGC
jgi:hypothetical protein